MIQDTITREEFDAAPRVSQPEFDAYVKRVENHTRPSIWTRLARIFRRP